MADIDRKTSEMLEKPSGMLPVYNENIIVLSSPNKQSGNFKWQIELKCSNTPVGAGWETISNLIILPNPQGYGIIDVSRHIENYISSQFDYKDKYLAGNDLTNNRNWYLNITESFDNTSWVFDDFHYYLHPTTNISYVGFRSFTDKHPYKVGDVVNIVQEGTPTNPSYDGQHTIIHLIDDYIFITDQTYGVSTALPEGGQSTLEDITERTIKQLLMDEPFDSFIGVQNFNDYVTYTETPYLHTTLTTESLLLSNLPTEFTLTSGSNLWVHALNNGNDISGVLLETNKGFFWINQGTSVNSTGNKVVRLKIGPKDLIDANLAGIDPYQFSGGTLPAFDNNTTQYKFYFTIGNPGTGITKIGKEYIVNVENTCSKYEQVTFFFMDRFGSFLPITFNKLSRKNIENKRETYKQNYGTFNSTTNNWGYNTYDRGGTTYDIQTKKTITCNSDYVDEQTQELIHIMLTSPEVYYLDLDGNMNAINITTNTYEERKKVNDKLINFTITFEYAQNDRNQRA